MIVIVVTIIVLMTIAAFFSAAETALTAASKPLMHQLNEEGDQRAGTVTRLLDQRERLISTALLGNNVVNILASALTTSVMIEAFGNEGVVYATVIMTFLIVIYGEILPKTYALLHTTTVSLRVAGIMSALVAIFHPFNVGVEYFINGALKLFRVTTARTRSAQQILAELRGTIELQMAERTIREEIKHERAMLRSVLDLTGVEVGEILIHRKKIVTIDADLPISDIIEQVAASPYSRIPLWRDQPDNIVGVLHAKNLLRAIESAGGQNERVDVVALATPPWFIPETTKLLDQMNAFRARREHFGIVVDEYGGVSGMVTIEDVLEQIVGEIEDEFDFDETEDNIIQDKNGHYRVKASTEIEDFNEYFNVSFSNEEFSTIGGLIIQAFGHLPKRDEKITFQGFKITILRADSRKLYSVLLEIDSPVNSV